MKLGDIDVLINHRAAYNGRLAQVRALQTEKNPAVEMAGTYVKDLDILAKVKALLQVEVQKKYEEIKTKLMMLGVDEFPE